MTDRELISVGFQPHGDGSLHSPARITLTPAGEFYRLTIAFPGGDVLTCHVAKVALKISKEVKPMNAAPHLVDKWGAFYQGKRLCWTSARGARSGANYRRVQSIGADQKI